LDSVLSLLERILPHHPVSEKFRELVVDATVPVWRKNGGLTIPFYCNSKSSSIGINFDAELTRDPAVS